MRTIGVSKSIILLGMAFLALALNIMEGGLNEVQCLKISFFPCPTRANRNVEVLRSVFAPQAGSPAQRDITFYAGFEFISRPLMAQRKDLIILLKELYNQLNPKIIDYANWSGPGGRYIDVETIDSAGGSARALVRMPCSQNDLNLRDKAYPIYAKFVRALLWRVEGNLPFIDKAKLKRLQLADRRLGERSVEDIIKELQRDMYNHGLRPKYERGDHIQYWEEDQDGNGEWLYGLVNSVTYEGENSRDVLIIKVRDSRGEVSKKTVHDVLLYINGEEILRQKPVFEVGEKVFYYSPIQKEWVSCIVAGKKNNIVASKSNIGTNHNFDFRYMYDLNIEAESDESESVTLTTEYESAADPDRICSQSTCNKEQKRRIVMTAIAEESAAALVKTPRKNAFEKRKRRVGG